MHICASIGLGQVHTSERKRSHLDTGFPRHHEARNDKDHTGTKHEEPGEKLDGEVVSATALVQQVSCDGAGAEGGKRHDCERDAWQGVCGRSAALSGIPPSPLTNPGTNKRRRRSERRNTGRQEGLQAAGKEAVEDGPDDAAGVVLDPDPAKKDEGGDEGENDNGVQIAQHAVGRQAKEEAAKEGETVHDGWVVEGRADRGAITDAKGRDVELGSRRQKGFHPTHTL